MGDNIFDMKTNKEVTIGDTTRKSNVFRKLLVIQLDEKGISRAKISEMTGIATSTVYEWLKSDNRDFISLNSNLSESVQKTLDKLETRETIDITELKHDIIKQLQIKVNDGTMSGSQLGILYGILFDKARLLQGKGDNKTVTIEVMIKQAMNDREENSIKNIKSRVIDVKSTPVKD